MKKLLLFLVLISTSLIAQEEVKVDLSNPNSSIYTHLYFLQSDSYEPEKAATTIYGFEGKEAERIAIKIKRILDGKGLRIDFKKVPSNNDYNDTIDINNGTNRYVLFPYQMPEIYVEKIDDNWYYSKETIQLVDEIYSGVYPWFTEKMLKIVPSVGHKTFLTIELWQYLGLLILVIACVILFYLLDKITFFLLKKIQFWIVHKTHETFNTALKKVV